MREHEEKDYTAVIAENMYKISPYSEKSITSLGYAYFLNGRFNEALEVYEKALTFIKESPAIYYHMSAVYGAYNNPEKAIEYAEKAIALDNNNPGAYYNIAVAHYKLKDYKNARKVLNTMLSKFPDDANAKGLMKVINNEVK